MSPPLEGALQRCLGLRDGGGLCHRQMSCKFDLLLLLRATWVIGTNLLSCLKQPNIKNNQIKCTKQWFSGHWVSRCKDPDTKVHWMLWEKQR